MKNHFDDLVGKAVLVTGSSTGIGAAVAIGFANCGSKVAVHCNRSRDAGEKVVAEIRKSGGEAILLQADVSKSTEATRVVEETVAAFGTIDILVNNAGGLVQRTLAADNEDEIIRRYRRSQHPLGGRGDTGRHPAFPRSRVTAISSTPDLSRPVTAAAPAPPIYGRHQGLRAHHHASSFAKELVGAQRARQHRVAGRHLDAVPQGNPGIGGRAVEEDDPRWAVWEHPKTSSAPICSLPPTI